MGMRQRGNPCGRLHRDRLRPPYKLRDRVGLL